MDKKYLETFILNLGASFVGFSDVSEKLPVQLKKYNNAISIGVRLSDAIIDEISDKPTFTYFHHYRTVNTFIDQLTLRLMLHIQSLGYKAISVAASQTVNDSKEAHCAIFPHKTAAVLAGLGWIGKSSLFISDEFGPRVRLGTVLTDMPINAVNSLPAQNCGECRLCAENCPAMAITGSCWESGSLREHIVDVNACSKYMTTKFKNIGRGAVCGICMRVCPKGIVCNI